MLDAQLHALQVRNRLRNPLNAKHSTETDVVPVATWHRQKNNKKLQEQRAQADFKLQSSVADAIKAARAADQLLAALKQRAEVLDIARKLFSDEQPRPPTTKEILGEVCRYFKISETDVCSARRTTDVMRPRQIAMYLARTLTLNSLPQIGNRIGGRDHTTVLHGWRKIKWAIPHDPELAADVEAIKQALGC